MAEPVRARRLSEDEGRRLQQIVRRGKHGTIRVRRALIIMASASGTPVPAIARRRVGPPAGRTDWSAFSLERLAGAPMARSVRSRALVIYLAVTLPAITVCYVLGDSWLSVVWSMIVGTAGAAGIVIGIGL